MKSIAKRLVQMAGYELTPLSPPISMKERYPDITEWEWSVYSKVKPYTMLSLERILANVRAIDHVVQSGIAGDIVECGVWRGGSAMSMALALLRHEDADRSLWLYDTYEGMTEPDAVDVSRCGVSGASLLEAAKRLEKRERSLIWAYAALPDVQRNMASTKFPTSRVHFIEGPVEETIPATVPDRIAVLRLDTDWYESTHHELKHLYPKLSMGGLLIIDDYGDWQGARKAVDDYFAEHRVFLHRIDNTGRVVVKGAELSKQEF